MNLIKRISQDLMNLNERLDTSNKKTEKKKTHKKVAKKLSLMKNKKSLMT